ncbi:hypothetical protein N825_16610 [Skermanella stibiiresistens SB22]|uniref:Uncharacterized protein n=2 Tax=Skermanella TaxID=204447 RepID=W9H1Q3_9PROT|nr:hypothetical protein N825_16610 [Skermanella stibiiresistens SB22]
MSPLDQIYAEYATARDQVLKQTHSSHVGECLDAIRPLWVAYQDKLRTLSAAEDVAPMRLSA